MMKPQTRLEYHHNYYNKNKDKILEYGRDYYLNNKDKIQDYYENNKDKIYDIRRVINFIIFFFFNIMIQGSKFDFHCFKIKTPIIEFKI